MNNSRRKDLKNAITLIERASEVVSDTLDDEEYAFSNLPDGICSSERGEKMEAAVDSMQFAIDGMEEVIRYIEEAME